MRNRYNIILIALMSFLVTSCVSEVEDLFEDSASTRLEKEVNKYRDLLISSERGWLMEYYPGGTNQTYGGYALTAVFRADGSVEVQSIMSNDVSKMEKSLYSVGKDVGATLNFVTYNNLFHYFSDPDHGDLGDGTGVGMEGDHEFVFERGDDSEIVMTGKKHRSVIHMYPLKESATEYLTKVKKVMKSLSDIPAFYAVKGTYEGEPVEGEFISRQSLLLTQGEEHSSFSFIFTDKGIKLYKPIDLNDKKVNDLFWNPGTRTFSSPEGKTILQLVTNPYGLKEDDFLGEYSMYTYATGGTAIDVSIVRTEEGSLKLKGLPFDLYLEYNWRQGVLELNPQYVKRNPDVVTYMWAAFTTGGISINSGVGLKTKWNGSMDNFIIEFVDNGNGWFYKGEKNYADGFILLNISAGGEQYTEFGLSQFLAMRLIKK